MEENYDCRNDFDASMPPDAYPRFWEEGCALDAARKDLTIDKLLSFIHFDDDTGWANISKKVAIKVRPNPGVSGSVLFDVYDSIADVNKDGAMIATIAHPAAAASPITAAQQARDELEAGFVRIQQIVPPTFGVTMLGVSDGFDKDGSTTGFVIWMHNAGIMVDPPPNASELLDRMGIPAAVIEGTILTHCHADHARRNSAAEQNTFFFRSSGAALAHSYGPGPHAC